jgi:hypothetical protein
MPLVLLIPADPSRPTRLEHLPDGPEDRLVRLRQLVGGAAEIARYDRDAHLYVNADEGPLGLPVNPRVTRYVRQRSLAAKLHRAQGCEWPSTYVLRGDVVLAGGDPLDPDGDLNVPLRFQPVFGTLGQLPDHATVVGDADRAWDAPNVWGFPAPTVLWVGCSVRGGGLGPRYAVRLPDGHHANVTETLASDGHWWVTVGSVTPDPASPVVYDQADLSLCEADTR